MSDSESVGISLQYAVGSLMSTMRDPTQENACAITMAVAADRVQETLDSCITLESKISFTNSQAELVRGAIKFFTAVDVTLPELRKGIESLCECHCDMSQPMMEELHQYPIRPRPSGRVPQDTPSPGLEQILLSEAMITIGKCVALALSNITYDPYGDANEDTKGSLGPWPQGPEDLLPKGVAQSLVSMQKWNSVTIGGPTIPIVTQLAVYYAPFCQQLLHQPAMTFLLHQPIALLQQAFPVFDNPEEEVSDGLRFMRFIAFETPVKAIAELWSTVERIDPSRFNLEFSRHASLILPILLDLSSILQRLEPQLSWSKIASYIQKLVVLTEHFGLPLGIEQHWHEHITGDAGQFQDSNTPTSTEAQTATMHPLPIKADERENLAPIDDGVIPNEHFPQPETDSFGAHPELMKVDAHEEERPMDNGAVPNNSEARLEPVKVDDHDTALDFLLQFSQLKERLGVSLDDQTTVLDAEYNASYHHEISLEEAFAEICCARKSGCWNVSCPESEHVIRSELCTECFLLRYCSPKCQKEAWASGPLPHEALCSLIQCLMMFLGDEDWLLLGTPGYTFEDFQATCNAKEVDLEVVQAIGSAIMDVDRKRNDFRGKAFRFNAIQANKNHLLTLFTQLTGRIRDARPGEEVPPSTGTDDLAWRRSGTPFELSG